MPRFIGVAGAERIDALGVRQQQRLMTRKRNAKCRCNPAKASAHCGLVIGKRIAQALGKRSSDRGWINQGQSDPALND